jgi:IPT/TIG domain
MHVAENRLGLLAFGGIVVVLLLCLCACGGGISTGSPSMVAPPPSITSLSPASAAVGAPVTITGENFGATQSASTVTFNGTAATPISWSATSIMVTVPAAATTGDVIVTVNGVPSAGVSFTALQTPAVADFFVATNGNDAWSGTLPAPNANNSDGPFATLSRARIAVRGVSRSGRTTAIAVMVRGGAYYCGTMSASCSTLAFTAADSGTSSVPVVYENYPAETPVISGGIRVTGWTNTGGNAWTASLNPAVISHFEALYYNGNRRYRPRANGGNYLRLASTNPVSTCGSGTDPCFDRFYYNPGDVDPNWKQLAQQCSGGQTTNCYPPGDILVRVFDKWAVPAFRLDHADSAIAYLRSQSINDQRNYGFIGAAAPHRYIVENVAELCCSAQQWFLDQFQGSNWVLNYVVDANARESDPNNDSVVIPQLTNVLAASNLSYVTFSGITFSHGNFVVPSGAYPAQNCTDSGNCVAAVFQGLPDVTAAVSCVDCNNVTFEAVTVSHTSGWGLEVVPDPAFSGTVSDDSIQDSAFFDIGSAGAIRLGLTPQKNQPETDASVPQNILVQNNIVQGVGRMYPGGSDAIWTGIVHDTTITHNDVNDTYHSGIGVCVPDANNCIGAANSRGAFNITVSNNHIWNIGQGVTDDMGCIYFATFGAVGNRILNNRCHDVTDASSQDSDGYGGNGIYLDGTTYGITVQNNLVYRVSWVGFLTNEGPQAGNQPNDVVNNIFAYSRMASVQRSHEVPSGPVLWANVTNNIFYYDISDQGLGENVVRGCYYCWGHSCAQTFNFDKNTYWHTTGDFGTAGDLFMLTDNACSSTSITALSYSTWRALPQSEDPDSVVQDPGFANPNPPYDFSFAGAPPPNFTPLNIPSMGRTSTAIIPPQVPAGFPTASVSSY